MASGQFFNDKAIEGELLAARLASSALTPQDALRFAIEIGQALGAAHDAGRMHGSLTPEHVMLTREGARVLSPIRPAPASAERYRSPEQVAGAPVDWRTDIFSYGALLYEMLSGKPAFEGEGTVLDQAILTATPAPVPAASPLQRAMAVVIAGCLQKDPAKRRQRIRNAVIELKFVCRALPALGQRAATARAIAPAPPAVARGVPPAALPESALPASPAPASRWTRRFTIVTLAVVAIAAAALAALTWFRQRPSLLPPPVNFSVSAPEDTTYPGTPAISPDGLHLAFSAVGPEGQRMLWLRALDEMHAQIIPGTEGGFAPFWSPDSEWLGFFANKTLKKVRVRDVTPTTRPVSLGAADAQPGGGTWNRDGIILFAPGMSGGLYRIPAAGGAITMAAALDPSKAERAHLWPQFLPDGKHFVFFNQTASVETTGVFAGSLDATTYRKLFTSETNAVYSHPAGAESAKSGYLLYIRDRDLVVQGFNASRLAIEGDPVTLEVDVGALRTLALAPISVSANAVLVYQTVGQSVRQLIWTDRTGKQTGTLGEGALWGPPRISPDGARVAVGKLGADGVNADLWIFDAAGNASQFVYRKGVAEGFPVWSPDGSRIAFWSNPDGVYDLYVQTVASNRLEPLYRNQFGKLPTDWSRDGRFLFFTVMTPGTKSDVWAISLADKRAGPIIDTIHNEGQAALSPDGKWLAYQAEEAGSIDVYVRRFDGISSVTRRLWRISTPADGAAGEPRWRRDGKELFYLTTDGSLMVVSVTPNGDEFAFSAPQRLLQTRPIPKTWNLFDVSPDGERFLLNVPLEWSTSSVITVLTNWTEKLKR